MTRLALPSMLANKWGRIINIASAHGLVASPYKWAYVAAKHGIVGLTKVTAVRRVIGFPRFRCRCLNYRHRIASRRRLDEATMRAFRQAPWQGEFDPIEGVILHESMPDLAIAAE